MIVQPCVQPRTGHQAAGRLAQRVCALGAEVTEKKGSRSVVVLLHDVVEEMDPPKRRLDRLPEPAHRRARYRYG